MIDRTESAAKRYLGFGIQMKTGEDQHAVVFQRVEYRVGEQVVGDEPGGVNAEHFRAHR